MSNLVQNLTILAICWLLATGGGVYMTFFEQPAEMDRLEKAEKVARMKQAELSSLMTEMTQSEEIADEVVVRWNARYKVVPRTLSSEDVIAFLNEHTANGFQPFDIVFKGHNTSRNFNTFTFDVTGRGHFPALYELIWSIENSRQLYRVNNLKLTHMDLRSVDPRTGREKMDVMVSFDFTLEAFYGGIAGLSVEDELADVPGAIAHRIDPSADLPHVPESVLPPRRVAGNPFYPVILDAVPPNSDNLVNVEEAKLTLIANGEAVFEWMDTFISVGAGDPVYLGQLISVDPRNGRVVARLNKGGIIDEIEMVLDTGDLFRQALGPVQLAPSQKF